MQTRDILNSNACFGLGLPNYHASKALDGTSPIAIMINDTCTSYILKQYAKEITGVATDPGITKRGMQSSART